MKKVLSLEKKQKRFGYIFVLPFIIGAVFFIIIPFGQAIIYSFTRIQITESGFDATFIGLDNYRRIFFVNPDFRIKIVDSIGNMLLNVPIVIIFSFFVASLLNTKFIGRGIARAVLFMPVIISSGIILSLTRRDLMNFYLQTGSNVGVWQNQGVNLAGAFINVMNEINIDARIVSFISDSVNRIFDITTMSAIPIVIFLAGLQTISNSVFEAAYIEGATKWEVFWKISFPLVSPLILVCIIYSVIDSFTNVSNPVIEAIHSKSFEEIRYAMGLSMALSYMLIVLFFLSLSYKIISKYVFYQDR